MYVRRAALFIILHLVAGALSSGSSTERSSNNLEADDATGTAKKRDLDDNVADSSVTSYSSVVIHHSTAKSKEGAHDEDQEKQASRSESYFKMHNVHGKDSGKEEKRYTRRPSYSSSSPGTSSSSPASASQLTQEPKNHRTESSRTKLRDITNENLKSSFPKIKHFESDFRPIEGPTTEEPKRPQRLVNHHYNPHHHESDEDISTSLASSQEIYRKEPKYKDYDHSSSEVYQLGEQYSEEITPKYKGYKDEKKHASFRNTEYPKTHRGNYKHYSDDSNHKTPEYSTIFKSSPSTETRNQKGYTSYYSHSPSNDGGNQKDYSSSYHKPSSNGGNQKEYSSYHKPSNDGGNQNEYSSYHKPSSDGGNQNEYSSYHKPSSDGGNQNEYSSYHKPSSDGGNQNEYSNFYKNSPSSDSYNHQKDYSTIFKSTVKHVTPTPPPGMSEELMETLLQQEPQKFRDGGHVKSAYSYSPKKKFKSADSPTAFNVGYSIGFGGAPSDDVILGKPKDAGLKIHVNGEKSIWKQLNHGVEMSHSVDKSKPIQFRIPDSSPRPKINVLKSGGSAVYYTNNNSPDIDTVPTAGKSTFDHNQALTSLTQFDFSNAMPGPIALPLHSNIGADGQPYSLKTKSGRNLDVMSLYQSMGYSPPIPVLIPSGPKGEAQMVHAIVIPLQSLPNADFGWGQLSGMFAPAGIIPSSGPQPVHFNSITPINSVHHDAINHNSVSHPSSPSHHNSVSHSPSPNGPYKSHHSISINHHPVSNPFPAIPEKVRYPKYRKAKDAFKSASTFSSPIVVQPIHDKNKKDLQKELNAILAQEMSRKNQRQPPLGLRPPPPQ